MKLRLAFLELCGLLAFGQTQFEQLPIPAPPQGPLPYVTIGFTDGSQLKYTEPPYELATASDGTLQIAQTQPLSNTPQLPLALPGLLFIQPGFAGAKITQAGGINMNGFTEHDLMYGSGIAAWGFSNQSGNISYICDGAPIPLDAMPFGYFGEQCVLTRITPTGVQPVCTGYSLDGTPGSLPYFWRGLSYDSAGNLYFIGMPADYGSSTIYRMLQSDIPATTGICQVETALKTNWQVFHAYPFENNQFLATIADSPENVGLAVFGIAVLNADGSSNVLVSTNAKSAPQILATGYPSLFWDAAKQRGLIAYNAGDAGHRRLFENGGMLPEVSDPNIANLGGDYVTAIGLNGDFALIGAGGSVKTDDHYTVAKNLIEINLADGSSGFINESTPLSGGFTASSGFRYGSAAATSDGTAYFVASNSTSTSIFGGKIPLASQPLAPVVSITAAQSSITAGGTVQLSWTAQMATSVAISPNIGPVAATGSQLISPTTTTTYTLTATGPGGTATVSVLVTVAVAPPTVSAVVNGGSFKLGPVAPGSL
ncbi:MAG: hypothetical protein KGJ13_06560, partial [Patescibacteria group bacterium]|nr:hypothetical protein [Patescibacteria group bacterium]